MLIAPFANTSTNPQHEIGGRWLTGGYEVLVRGGEIFLDGPIFLGTVHEPLHPVMAGVATFNGGLASFRPLSTTLTPGSTLIAEWSDGSVLVAEGPSPQRIDLGILPPSSDCLFLFWDSTTDGAAMMANALNYVGGGVEPGFGYGPGDGTGTTCPCANVNNGSMGGCDWGDPAFPGGGALAGTGTARMLVWFLPPIRVSPAGSSRRSVLAGG